jgi:ribosomal protein L34E
MTEDPLGRLGPITGRAGDVSVTLTDLSFRQTSTGRRFQYPEFGPDFIAALHGSLVAPKRQGLVRSKLVCPSCESFLEGIAVERVAVTTEIALTRIPPVRVELEMPGMTCPGCHRSLVMIGDRAVASELSDALIDAFKGAGIAPG